MKPFLAVITLALGVLLAGCAGPRALQTGKVDPAMSKLQVQAQATVNEARRILISADQLIGSSVASDIWTPDEGQKYLDIAKDYRKRLDATQAVLDKGDFQKAISEAGLQQVLIDKLLQEVVARANAAKKPPIKPVTGLLPVLAAEFNPEGRRTW